MPTAPAPKWTLATMDELSAADAHAILAARQAVFVVEQNCVYLDADAHDLPPTLHLVARAGDDPAAPILAYLRVLAPGTKYAEASLGRVLTTAAGRGQGLGRALVARGLEVIAERFGRVPVRIGAQKYLEGFYGEYGFVRAGEDYVEDGIPHLEMLRPA